MSTPSTQFKRSQSAEAVIMLKRKLHNIRYVLFIRHFVDTRDMTKIALLDIKGLNSQYVIVRDMYLKEEKKPFWKKIIPRIRVWAWKLKNNITKFDEELWQ